MEKEQVILVDENDNPIGVMGKMEVHRKGLLHRAVSVFIFNSDGKWLIQQRDTRKYHSGGLWSNAACSHPRPGENNCDTAERRLKEEMGLDVRLTEIFHFTYRAEFSDQLTEHELDHIFIGYSDMQPEIDPVEAMDWSYLSSDELLGDIAVSPEKYSIWFRLLTPKVFEYLKPKL